VDVLHGVVDLHARHVRGGRRDPLRRVRLIMPDMLDLIAYSFLGASGAFCVYMLLRRWRFGTWDV
jgi:hypothetical protein